MNIDFIQPLPEPSTSQKRVPTTLQPTTSLPSFRIQKSHKSYKHQYSNIYFVRLRLLRQFVEKKAKKRWEEALEDGNVPMYVPRVLEVIKGKLCWIVGTVYMDMPLKPNILEDISREHGLPPLPPGNYASKSDKIMLEDESGRIQLVGEPIQSLVNEDEDDEQANVNANKANLVTGVILAVLGTETPNGAFEVVDYCFGGMPSQPASSSASEKKAKGGDDDIEMAPPETDTENDIYVAFVSGLSINLPSPSDARTQLLVEYLCGELATTGEDFIPPSQISRLVICGNSLAPMLLTGKGEADADGIRRGIKEKKKMIGTRIAKGRKYGYDSTTFSPHPTRSLSSHLLDLARVMPIHILPGESDPAGTILPQQPFPKGMFGAVGAYDSLSCETNPAWLKIKEGKGKEKGNERTFLIHSGQPLNDMFKYLPIPPPNSTLPTLPSSTGPTSSFPFSFPSSLDSSSQHSSNSPNSPSIPPNNPHALTKLSLMHSTLHWRHIAPTAPDTLWCHPYFDKDPFILEQTPDVYVVGGQEEFGTGVVEGDDLDGQLDEDESPRSKPRCRLVLVPSFSETGLLVLLNMRTLDVRTVRFGVEGMTGGIGEDDEDEDINIKKEEEVDIKVEIDRSPRSPDTDLPEEGSQMY